MAAVTPATPNIVKSYKQAQEMNPFTITAYGSNHNAFVKSKPMADNVVNGLATNKTTRISFDIIFNPSDPLQSSAAYLYSYGGASTAVATIVTSDGIPSHQTITFDIPDNLSNGGSALEIFEFTTMSQ